MIVVLLTSGDEAMRGHVPDSVLTVIADRYRAGVYHAEKFFDMHRDDEDALTGGLGQSIAMTEPLTVRVSESLSYRVYMDYWKVRGRGAGAPEKRFGTDGIFQVSVTNGETAEEFRKGLPFQAKKLWSNRDSRLAEQAQVLVGHFGDGLVVDYRREGYRGCRAADAVARGGSNRSIARAGMFHPLGELLAKDFLECQIGRVGLFYHRDSEMFLVDGGDLHVVSTEVVAVREAGMVRE